MSERKVQKLPSGAYRVTVYIGRDEYGKRKYVSCTDKTMEGLREKEKIAEEIYFASKEHHEKAQFDGKTYVYFVSDGNGHTKIGRTGSLSERMRKLQTGNPFKLKIVRLIECSGTEESSAIEKCLHELYEDNRIPGTEWFIL